MVTSSFMPHGICYLWQPGLVGLHLVSDAVIALSYFSIPLTLVHIVRKRADLPFDWVFMLFAAFIILCGSGHLIDIWTLWHPHYWVSGVVKAMTAVVSLMTAVTIVVIVPKILMLPSRAQLEEMNQRLVKEVQEREQAQAELKKSEERWQLALEGTGDGIFDWNIQTNAAFMSSWLKGMLGYADDEIANTYEGWRNCVHPDDLARVQEKIQSHLERKTPKYVVEYRMRCKDNRYKWILGRGQVQWDKTGQPIRMVGSHQDIAERKQAEAEIARLNQELEQRVIRRTAQLEAANHLKEELLRREREARAEIQLYQDIVENMQVGLCVWRLENPGDISSFQLVTTNPAAAQMLGISLQECVGQRVTECFPNALGNEHQGAVEAYAEVARTGQARKLGAVHYGDERISQRILDIKAFPLPNQCVGAAFENITERKRIEKALVESTRRYRLVVNSVKEVIFQTDSEGQWTFLNFAWTEITGFTVIESLNHPFTDYVFALEEQQRCAQLFQRLISGEQSSFHCEFRIQTKDGNFRWLEINAQLNQNEEVGESLGTSGTLNDITERKKTEAVLQARADELVQLNAVLLKTTAQLEKRNQELDQFAYVASHDLKAPLRAIANLSEWLEEDLAETLTTDTHHHMQLLRGRVHRLEALINALLQYSRVGRIQANPERVKVSQLLTEVLEVLSPPDGFTIEVTSSLPTLVTERLPLQQVLMNLIDNAIKHHHCPQGKVTISVQEQGKFYEFAVSDDGPGIAPAYHDKVFIIFQTLEARDKTENTGIGLSIVKKAVENQGGTIQLESQLGQGTTFRFTWPKLKRDKGDKGDKGDRGDGKRSN